MIQKLTLKVWNEPLGGETKRPPLPFNSPDYNTQFSQENIPLFTEQNQT